METVAVRHPVNPHRLIVRIISALIVFIFISDLSLPCSASAQVTVSTSSNSLLGDPKAASSEEVSEQAGSDMARGSLDDILKKKISVEYKDVDLASVLRSLSWAHKLNIVTAPDIKGKVSINLGNVSVEQALDAILKVNGLTYSKREGVIYVSTGDPNQVEQSTDVIMLKYIKADAASGIAKKLLSSKGDIRLNEAANSLVVTDFPTNLVKIKDLIKKVDTAPRQILIEAKIVDITSTDLSALGLQWNYDYQPKKGGLFDRLTKDQEALTGSFNMTSTDSTLDTGQLTLDALDLKNANFSGSVDALIRDGKANLLASPSIAVLNGQEARIVIGERYPYKERTQTTTGTTETTKFVDVGTTLRVNPQINDDGYITLYIHPEVSSVEEKLDAGPRIKTREADTTVRVKENETLVIGGLIKQEDTITKEDLPFFGKLPIIGLLFGRDSSSKSQTELAVFITPKILYSREEQKLLKKKDEEDDYVLLTETSKLNMVDRIFQKARALDVGRGVESKSKDEVHEKAQALSHYQLIFLEFPECVRAPEARYRAACIYRDYYKDTKKAMKNFLACATDYPHSRFSVLAKKAYRDLEASKKTG